MTRPPHREARRIDGVWTWSDSRGAVEVRFLGRGAPAGRSAALARVAPTAPPASALRQVHSARVVRATPAGGEEADALWTEGPGLAPSVATADCVPLLLAAGRRVAAVHAGWRGIAGDVAGAAAGAVGSAASLAAWIGPAIGACCYEVGEEVAGRVAAASDAAVVRRRPGERPHLDLAAAVAVQLRRRGCRRIVRLGGCTRCDPERLWSYRRDGEAAGRNLAFVWLRG